ncbi:hypothetical protein H6P81_000456 [Aristolochia fimbriata]|uniref:Uncharacterized protein n=1 Tax=Aristolochia fimbriata TaxID=158543 RepID=A0AAV7F4E9_ARIFI|nr:hypothetical protein H6P81_000456 [Aristolochia fimbriata]
MLRAMNSESGAWNESMEDEWKMSWYEGEDEKLKAESDDDDYEAPVPVFEEDELESEQEDELEDDLDISDGFIGNALELLIDVLESRTGRQRAIIFALTFFVVVLPPLM